MKKGRLFFLFVATLLVPFVFFIGCPMGTSAPGQQPGLDPVYHTITWNLSGGQWGNVAESARPTSIRAGAMLSLPVPAWPGFVFDRWVRSVGHINAPITGNTNFTAIWRFGTPPPAGFFEFYFICDYNGQIGPFEIGHGQTPTPPLLTRSGFFTFAYWEPPISPITSNTSFTARWFEWAKRDAALVAGADFAGWDNAYHFLCGRTGIAAMSADGENFIHVRSNPEAITPIENITIPGIQTIIGEANGNARVRFSFNAPVNTPIAQNPDPALGGDPALANLGIRFNHPPGTRYTAWHVTATPGLWHRTGEIFWTPQTGTIGVVPVLRYDHFPVLQRYEITSTSTNHWNFWLPVWINNQGAGGYLPGSERVFYFLYWNAAGDLIDVFRFTILLECYVATWSP